jgi:MinD-like ATPase involved in chromosome partitioning or flagellar assembly
MAGAQNAKEQVFLFSSVTSIKQMFPCENFGELRQSFSNIGITWIYDFSTEASLLNARSTFATAGACACAWVYELETIPSINFAAALVLDSPRNNVYMFADAISGSLKSRAKQAGITELVEPSLLKVNISALMSKLSSVDGPSFMQRECCQVLEEEPLQEFQSISIYDDGADTTTYLNADTASVLHADEAVCMYVSEDAGTYFDAAGCAYSCINSYDDSYAGADLDACETVLLSSTLSESAKALIGNSVCKEDGAQYGEEPCETKNELCEKDQANTIAHKNFSIKHAFLLPVVSASGGSGKSSICAISALVSAQMGYKTLVVDADFQFGDMREFLCDTTCIDRSVFYDTNTLASLLDTPSRLPFVVAAPKKLEMAESAQDAISDLLFAADDFFDVIIVNTQSFWTESHVFLLNNASKALFVLDQRCSSIEACSKAISFCSRCGIAPSTYLFVLNKCSRKSSLHASEVSLRLGGARVLELPDGSKDVDEYISSGAAKDLIEERNVFCVSIENILSEILPEAGVLKTKNVDGKSLQGILARTFRRKVAACLC